MFRIYFTNHFYFAGEEFASLAQAIAGAKRFGFECSIYQGETRVGGWDIFGGFKAY